MAENRHIVDATPENFAELVLGNSMRGPVMVNFWSARAGPCIKLWPLLEKLVNEYSGRFLLVNFNTDKYRDFARRELAVASVPTVKMYYQQQVMDVIHGAESETGFRNMIERHLPRPSDPLLVDAVKQYEAQSVDAALKQLRDLHKADRDNPRIPLTLVKLLFREGRLDEMLDFISTLPTASQRNEDMIRLSTHAQLIRAADTDDTLASLQQAVAESPDAVTPKYHLAARYLVNDRLTECMDLFLDIIRLDRSFKDDIAVKGMVAVLGMLGDDNPALKNYRQKMLDAMS